LAFGGLGALAFGGLGTRALAADAEADATAALRGAFRREVAEGCEAHVIASFERFPKLLRPRLDFFILKS
jgi:hypothetical protein